MSCLLNLASCSSAHLPCDTLILYHEGRRRGTTTSFPILFWIYPNLFNCVFVDIFRCNVNDKVEAIKVLLPNTQVIKDFTKVQHIIQCWLYSILNIICMYIVWEHENLITLGQGKDNNEHN